MKVRYEFVDIMKGLCILLVVGSHINVPGLTEYSLSYFRLPLYYMLSGLFFSQYESFISIIHSVLITLSIRQKQLSMIFPII